MAIVMPHYNKVQQHLKLTPILFFLAQTMLKKINKGLAMCCLGLHASQLRINGYKDRRNMINVLPFVLYWPD